MTIDTKEFENNLREYLRRIQSTGESITILAEAKPVALLIPLGAVKHAGRPTLIDRLVAQPMYVKEFTPLSRSEIYGAA